MAAALPPHAPLCPRALLWPLLWFAVPQCCTLALTAASAVAVRSFLSVVMKCEDAKRCVLNLIGGQYVERWPGSEAHAFFHKQELS